MPEEEKTQPEEQTRAEPVRPIGVPEEKPSGKKSTATALLILALIVLLFAWVIAGAVFLLRPVFHRASETVKTWQDDAGKNSQIREKRSQTRKRKATSRKRRNPVNQPVKTKKFFP